MIGVFKRKDGWTLEKELPDESPKQHYAFAFIKPFNIKPNFTFSDPTFIDTCYKVEFGLVDFWRNSAHKYIRVFYEEI